MNFVRRLICLLIAVTCLMAGAMAQVQTSELHVTVKDAKGAVVTGASVTAADAAKGISRAQNTNAEGIAVLLSLTPGVYSVTVEAQGFAKLVQSSVRLTIGQVAELNVTLSVAAASETVARRTLAERTWSCTTDRVPEASDIRVRSRNF